MTWPATPSTRPEFAHSITKPNFPLSQKKTHLDRFQRRLHCYLGAGAAHSLCQSFCFELIGTLVLCSRARSKPSAALPRKSSKPDWVKCFACFTIPKPSNFGPPIKQTTPSRCGLQAALKNARSSAHPASTHPPPTLLPLTFLSRLQLAHPVTCFCKVGDEQIWAGTFDSIIMFSNEGERLHSTSTGAGRMAFIRQGAVSYAPRA